MVFLGRCCYESWGVVYLPASHALPDLINSSLRARSNNTPYCVRAMYEQWQVDDTQLNKYRVQEEESSHRGWTRALCCVIVWTDCAVPSKFYSPHLNLVLITGCFVLFIIICYRRYCCISCNGEPYEKVTEEKRR